MKLQQLEAAARLARVCGQDQRANFGLHLFQLTCQGDAAYLEASDGNAIVRIPLLVVPGDPPVHGVARVSVDSLKPLFRKPRKSDLAPQYLDVQEHPDVPGSLVIMAHAAGAPYPVRSVDMVDLPGSSAYFPAEPPGRAARPFRVCLSTRSLIKVLGAMNSDTVTLILDHTGKLQPHDGPERAPVLLVGQPFTGGRPKPTTTAVMASARVGKVPVWTGAADVLGLASCDTGASDEKAT